MCSIPIYMYMYTYMCAIQKRLVILPENIGEGVGEGVGEEVGASSKKTKKGLSHGGRPP